MNEKRARAAMRVPFGNGNALLRSRPETKRKRISPSSSAGFTMLEVAVVMAIVGVLSLAIVSTTQLAQRGSMKLNTDTDLGFLRLEIHGVLQSGDNCPQNFTGNYPPNPSSITDFGADPDRVILTEGDFIINGVFEVGDIALADQTVPNPIPTSIANTIVIPLRKARDDYIGIDRELRIPIVFQLRDAGGGVPEITGCTSTADDVQPEDICLAMQGHEYDETRPYFCRQQGVFTGNDSLNSDNPIYDDWMPDGGTYSQGGVVSGNGDMVLIRHASTTDGLLPGSGNTKPIWGLRHAIGAKLAIAFTDRAAALRKEVVKLDQIPDNFPMDPDDPAVLNTTADGNVRTPFGLIVDHSPNAAAHDKSFLKVDVKGNVPLRPGHAIHMAADARDIELYAFNGGDAIMTTNGSGGILLQTRAGASGVGNIRLASQNDSEIQSQRHLVLRSLTGEILVMTPRIQFGAQAQRIADVDFYADQLQFTAQNRIRFGTVSGEYEYFGEDQTSDEGEILMITGSQSQYGVAKFMPLPTRCPDGIDFFTMASVPPGGSPSLCGGPNCGGITARTRACCTAVRPGGPKYITRLISGGEWAAGDRCT